MEKENKKARKIKSEKLNKILASGITVKKYEIDFDKIKSIDDILVVFRAMKVTLNWYSEECPDQFKEIYEKGFLKEK
jgi:sporulation protein YlmC with PRC-barrel domain